MMSTTNVVDPVELKRKWGVYSHGTLKQRCREISSDGEVVEGLFPARTINICAGDSGIGKSPLLYEMAECVAAGIPFLGHATKQGRVLYADYENGLGDVAEMIDRLTGHLGLPEPPSELYLWNVNDSPPNFAGLQGMIREVQPTLVIIDSLSAYRPEAEEKNSAATALVQEFRAIARDIGTTVIFVHHLKKPSDNSQYAPSTLDEVAHPRKWFSQCRGAGAIINSTDIRLGLAVPTTRGFVSVADSGVAESALYWRGFGRVHGEIPTTYLARVSGEDGGPMGYKRLSGASLLYNSDQEVAFSKLPENFRFKEAKNVYGRADQPTTDFLRKCVTCGILEKLPGTQGYVKLKPAE